METFSENTQEKIPFEEQLKLAFTLFNAVQNREGVEDLKEEFDKAVPDKQEFVKQAQTHGSPGVAMFIAMIFKVERE